MNSNHREYGPRTFDVAPGIYIESRPQGTWKLWSVFKDGTRVKQTTSKKAAMAYANSLVDSVPTPSPETERTIRVITGTGNAAERRELDRLCAYLRETA